MKSVSSSVRKPGATLGLVAILIAGLIATTLPVEAHLNGDFRLISLNNNKCVEVGNGSDHDSAGIKLQQWTCGPYTWQYWNALILSTDSNGYDTQTFSNRVYQDLW